MPSRIQTQLIVGKFLHDIKLLAKNEKELETLIHAVWIYRKGIGIEFGMVKCVILVLTELPNQDKIRTLGEKVTYKYTGILKADAIRQMKIKEYLWRTRKLLDSKLYCRNFIK